MIFAKNGLDERLLIIKNKIKLLTIHLVNGIYTSQRRS